MRRLFIVGILVALVGIPVGPLSAQDRLCFPSVPGITNCIEGRFREYWEQNGGLPVFGYPITAAEQQQTAEGTFLTQVFERNRFELHPENARPYDVLLGRLGDDRLKQLGRDWQTFPKGQQSANCLWFDQTGHSICQPFRSYWEANGLQDPALNQFGRSLALFGLPLSEPAVETNTSGDTVTTQWFERARFECHATILLGLLGTEVHTNPPIPAAKPVVACRVTTPAPPAPQPPGPPPPAPPTPVPPQQRCHPSYPDFCIPPPPPDLDCGDFTQKNFTVREPDPHRLDGDNDGIGCEE